MKIKEKLKEKIDGISDDNKLKEKADKISKNIILWAESNRKRTFVLTICFLAFCLVVTIATTVYYVQRSRHTKNEISLFRDNLRETRTQRKQMLQEDFYNYQKYKEYEKEVEELSKKDSLTTEDSLRIYELYNLLILNDIGK